MARLTYLLLPIALLGAGAGTCTYAGTLEKSRGVMTAEFKPNAAFRAYAAKILAVTPGEIEGGSIDAQGARTMPNSIGNAWAFTMWLKSSREREIRGWSTPDGIVVAPDQNLGILFTEAGVWRGKQSRDGLHTLANKLARSIVWAYGMNHTLPDEIGIKPPLLELNDKGAGTLTFVSAWRQPGPGGAGGGPKTYTATTVTLTPDHEATLSKAPFTR